jgi:hypothetical protein
MPESVFIVGGKQLRALALAALALVLAVLAVTVIVWRPAGDTDAAAAARGPLEDRARRGSLRVPIVRRWGHGALTLAVFDDRSGSRRVAFGFAIDRGRGWRLVASTERAVNLTDVSVGSLLVTTSSGGTGQPAWTAVYGEVGDARIATVEVRWDAGAPTAAERRRNAYLAVRSGVHKPLLARYLAANGSEVAKVPI